MLSARGGEMVAGVFISYSNEDRQRVKPLADAFEAPGIQVFWDRKIPPGSSWRNVLDRELTNAGCVLVVWSKSSIASPWVLEEAELGKERDALIPVRFDAVSPPLGFRAVQSADLSKWSGSDRDPGFLDLLSSVRARIGASPADPSSRTAITGHRSFKRVWVAAGAMVAVLIALAAIWTRRDHRRGEDGKSAMGSPTYRRVYYEDFSEQNAVQRDVWLLGQRGDWEGQVLDGWYRLCNRSGSMNASFTSGFSYKEGNVTPDQSDARATMTVRLQPPLSKYSAAGILYRAMPGNETYYAFALAAGQSALFLRKSGSSIKILSSWELVGLKDGSAVTLKVEGASSDLRLWVDDRQMPVQRVTEGLWGNPGVFAMGLGCFEYDNVSVQLATDR